MLAGNVVQVRNEANVSGSLPRRATSPLPSMLARGHIGAGMALGRSPAIVPFIAPLFPWVHLHHPAVSHDV